MLRIADRFKLTFCNLSDPTSREEQQLSHYYVMSYPQREALPLPRNDVTQRCLDEYTHPKWGDHSFKQQFGVMTYVQHRSHLQFQARLRFDTNATTWHSTDLRVIGQNLTLDPGLYPLQRDYP
jgi:hypothetical protein